MKGVLILFVIPKGRQMKGIKKYMYSVYINERDRSSLSLKDLYTIKLDTKQDMTSRRVHIIKMYMALNLHNMLFLVVSKEINVARSFCRKNA